MLLDNTKNYPIRLLANAVFLQLPFLLELWPEERIASHLSLAIQGANLLVPVYLLLRRNSLIRASTTVVIIVIVSFLGAFAFAAVWELTPALSLSTYHGVMSLTVLAGIIGCLSNLSFWEFAAGYHPSLISSLAIGNAFSSVLPAIVAAGQNPGDTAHFTFSSFFYINAAFLLISVCAIIATLFSPPIRRLKREFWADDDPQFIRPFRNHGRDNSSITEDEGRSLLPSGPLSSVLTAGSTAPVVSASGASVEVEQDPGRSRSRSRRERDGDEPPPLGVVLSGPGYQRAGNSNSMYLLPEPSAREGSGAWKELAVMAWISMVNYFFPGVVTYVTYGYEDNVLLLFTVMGMVGGTLGRIASAVVRDLPHIPFVILHLLLGATFLLGRATGWATWFSWLMSFANLVFTFLYGLQSTILFKTASMHIDTRFAQKLCRWLGAAEQLGALAGAILAFSLVFGGVFD